MEQYLDITPGSVSVMGLMNDKEKKVRLLIDEDVLLDEYFACHPCINTSSLRFKTSDLMEKVIPAWSMSRLWSACSCDTAGQPCPEQPDSAIIDFVNDGGCIFEQPAFDTKEE